MLCIHLLGIFRLKRPEDLDLDLEVLVVEEELFLPPMAIAHQPAMQAQHPQCS